MPSKTKKELYLAKSLEELNSKAEIENFGSKTLERILEFTEQFYKIANEELIKGNEERAYLYFYRIGILLTYLKNDQDQNIFLQKVGTKVKDAVEKIESLAANLEERYTGKNKSYEERKAQLFKSESIPVPGTSVKVELNEDEDKYECITPVKLVQLINSLAEINKVLLIDIRSAEEFNESSIAANKFSSAGEVNLINIPSSIIKPGLSYPTLRNKIGFGLAQDGMERRRSMDYIIIIDFGTYDFDKGCPSYSLADALYKWDQSPDKIKHKPLLLAGGYRDFLITYPTYCSNSGVIDNYSQNIPLTHQINKPTLGSYDFLDDGKANNDQNEFDKQGKTPSFHNPSGFNQTLDNYNNVGLKNINYQQDINNNNNNNNNNNKSPKFPGTAKPFIPDRSSKPNLESIKKSREASNDKKTIPNSNMAPNLRYLPPKPDHLISSLNNSNKVNGETNNLSNNGINIQNDVEMVTVKEKFNDMEADNKVDSSNHENIFNMDEEMSDYENNQNQSPQGDSDNESISHSVSKPSEIMNNNTNHYTPFSSSLSRSLSSPNIAQFEPKSIYPSESPSPSSKFSHQMPLVDRSVKPSPYINNFRKARDFSPQFSSCARITGLRNLGNTCFMNAILQCLKNTKELYEYLVSGNVYINQNSKFGSNGELTIELIELFKQMLHSSNYKHISPKDFKCAVSRHIPDFVDYKQQDAHEFLVRLLDRLHADLNRAKPDTNIDDPVLKDPNFYDKLPIVEAVKTFWSLHIKRNNSIITDLFEGLIVSTLSCLHCSSSSKSLEAFTCLTLIIPEFTGRKITLKNCINLFLRGERISNEAAWECQECRQKRDAEKCTFIWKLPKILIIHLKRFTYDGMWRQKISTFVDFPIDNLIIEARCGEEERAYSLYGVVNHFGSLEGGHYVAYSRNGDMNIDWNRYDDQDVSPISPQDVVTQNAYVLFYRSVYKE